MLSFDDGLCASLLPFVLSLLTVVVVASCGPDGSGEDVEVVSPRLVETQGGERSFTGVLVNHRRSPITIAQVEVALYDGSGSPVETIRIEVENVPAQDSVQFKGKIDSDRPFQQAQVQSVLTP